MNTYAYLLKEPCADRYKVSLKSVQTVDPEARILVFLLREGMDPKNYPADVRVVDPKLDCCDFLHSVMGGKTFVEGLVVVLNQDVLLTRLPDRSKAEFDVLGIGQRGGLREDFMHLDLAGMLRLRAKWGEEDWNQPVFALPDVAKRNGLRVVTWPAAGIFAGFDYASAPTYDMDAYFRDAQAVTFSNPLPGGCAEGTRCRAMEALLKHGLKQEPFDWSRIYRSRLDREMNDNLVTGKRRTPANKTLSAEVLVSVFTKEVKADLDRLLPTVAYHMPERPFHLVCDVESEEYAKEWAKRLGYDNLITHPSLNDKSLKAAEAKLSPELTKHADYWKPGPIWWKLEALRLILKEYNSKRGVLLVDCDITFCDSVDEVFSNVDLVMSPFYWCQPHLKVRRAPNDDDVIHIAERDGWFNAGYLLAGCEDVAKVWLELYESGKGGFYEQWIMGFLPQVFRYDLFGPLHNFGQWRREVPPEDVVSIHAHAWTELKKPFGIALQARANEEAVTAAKHLGQFVR